MTNAATLTYDPLNRLYEKGGTDDVKFVYDGSDLIAEYDGGTGALLRQYVHGPGADEPLLWYEGAGLTDKRWLAADERGSVVGVTMGSSSTTINTYDEYGMPGPANTGRFQYTGQKWLAEAGVYDYKARAYAPGLGRFLQPDPIRYGDGLNMYAYVGDDPLNRTDPTGLAGAEDELVITGHRFVPQNPWANQITFAGGWEAMLGSVALGGSGESSAAGAGGPGTTADDCDARFTLCITAQPRPRFTGYNGLGWLQGSHSISMNDDDREAAANEDEARCRSLSSSAARARCWASAADRDGDRAAGRTPRPLITQRSGVTNPQGSSPSPSSPNPWVTGGAIVVGGIVVGGLILLAPEITIPALIVGGGASQ